MSSLKFIEDDYVRLYTDWEGSIDFGKLGLFFMDLVPYAKEDPIVCITSRVKEKIATDSGSSKQAVDNALRKLVERNILVKMKEGKQIYMFNPFIVARGEWKDVKKLRKLFVEELDKGNTTSDLRIEFS